MLNEAISHLDALNSLHSEGLPNVSKVMDGVGVGLRKSMSRFDRPHQAGNVQPANARDISHLVKGAPHNVHVVIANVRHRALLDRLVAYSFSSKPCKTRVTREEYDTFSQWINTNRPSLTSYIKVCHSGAGRN
jgi:hypothetical protein